MSVLIQINGETAEEALKELAALAGPLSGGQTAQAETPKSAEKPQRASRATPKQEELIPKQEQPKQGEVEEGKSPAHVVDEALTEDETHDEPIPTNADLRALASEIGKKGAEAKAKVKALLDKYGSPNVSGVPDDKRIVFKRDLEKLLAEVSE